MAGSGTACTPGETLPTRLLEPPPFKKPAWQQAPRRVATLAA